MTAYLFDVIIVVILAFFAWRGAKKGLILTLCGLLGLFVAFFGAQFISTQFYKPVAHIVQPAIYQTIRNALPEPEQEPSNQLDDSVFATTPPFNSQETASSYTVDQLLEILEEKGLYAGFSFFLNPSMLKEAIPDVEGVPESIVSTRNLADYLAKLIAKAALFALSFLFILLIWFLVSHILDLAFQLPILAAVNAVGGLAVGLLKAVLIVFVLVWLGQLANIVPQNPTTPVLTLFTPKGLGAFLDQLLI